MIAASPSGPLPGRFGPLEMQACGENNVTINTLGVLAFRPDLRLLVLHQLLHASEVPDDGMRVSVLFFTRIGQEFFREAIQREMGEERVSHELERHCNQSLGLPETFAWARNPTGELTQPAQWKDRHIDRMLANNNANGDTVLRKRLSHLQDVFNTEPDVVLQWDRHLAIVEVKALSDEGEDQLENQLHLGQALAGVLGWDVRFFFLGPDWQRSAPSDSHFVRLNWGDVAGLFDSAAPACAAYIRDNTFFYSGRWCTLTRDRVPRPADPTAYDVVRQVVSTPSGADPGNGDVLGPWHFGHLGRPYFARVVTWAQQQGHWPITWVWTGRKGRPYAEGGTRPNLMVQTSEGDIWSSRTQGVTWQHVSLDAGHMHRWPFERIARYFDLPQAETRV